MTLADRQSGNEWLRESLRNLNSKDPNLRIWATKTLDDPQIVNEEIIPDLIVALQQTHFTVHYSIGVLLARFGTAAAPALSALIRVLTKETPWIFRPETKPDMPALGAMEAIAAIGAESIPMLREIVTHQDVRTQVVVTWTLQKLATRTAAPIPFLIELLNAADPWVRAQAAHALGECGKDANEAIPRLSDALRDKDIFLRAEATLALKKIEPGIVGDCAENVSNLVVELSSANETTRAKAAHTLGNMGEAARLAVPALVEVLGGNQPVVEAVGALTRIGIADSSIIPFLVDIVASRDDDVSALVASALVGIGPNANSVVPHLLAKMRRDWPGRRDAIMGFALLEPEPKQVVPVLTEIALRGLDPPDTIEDLARIAAVHSLGILAPRCKERIVPVLLRASHDPIVDVRSTAAFALAKLAMT